MSAPLTLAQAQRLQAFERFRQGRVVIETTAAGTRRSWNPDRRAMRVEMQKRGLSGGRQKVRLRKQLRVERRRRQAGAR